MVSISFVVPAYNEEKNIGLCLVSIIEVAQNLNNYEIIVVDNNSSDKTNHIASLSFYKRKGVRVIKEPKKGVMRARQAGYKVAKYDIIANIDADNVIPEGWLYRTLSVFDHDVVLMSGPIVYLDFSSFMRVVSSIFYAIGGLANLTIGPMSQGGNSIFRRSALDKVGGFNTHIDFYGDDTDIARKLATVGRVKFTRKMWVWGSGRRFKEEGYVTTTFRYVLNYLTVTLLNKPVTTTYKDCRP